MSYERTFWENDKTPINADNLNKLEEGVSANAEALSALSEDVSALADEVGTKAKQADLITVNNRVTTTQSNVEIVAGRVTSLGDRVTLLEASSGEGSGELPTGLLYNTDIAQTLDGAEADKIPSVSAVKTAIEEAKEEVLENIPSGSDASTVHYDEETDSLIVLKNGEWVETSLKAYTERFNLYVDNENGGEFTAYAGGTSSYAPDQAKAPTVTFADSLTVYQNTIDTSVGVGVGCAISKLIDLTRFKTLKLYHESSVSGANNIRHVKVFITQSKSSKMTPVVSQTLLQNQTSANGDVSIDISSLNGEYYIGIETQSYQNGIYTKTAISNMYME